MAATKRCALSLQEVTFPVPWGIMAAKAWGDPCAPPLLLLHGIQDNAGTFDRLIPCLPSHLYYLCLDLPGHGQSSRMPKGFRLDFMNYVLSINRVVRQLGWQRFTLVGHSLGGQLGQYYAAMYPEQVSRLIVLDAYGPGHVPIDDYLSYTRAIHDQVMSMESKLLDGEPPSYTYDVALEKMINNRRSFITREAAEALVPRNIKKGKNGYYFTPDQRLKLAVALPLSLAQHNVNYSNIKCPFLLVLTKDFANFLGEYTDRDKKTQPDRDEKSNSDRDKTSDRDRDKKSYLAVFRKNPLFELVVVEGAHDVHSISPEVVAPHINKFLQPLRSML